MAPAESASLRRIGDDLIEFRAYGDRLVFPAELADRISFFSPNACDPESPATGHFSKWLRDPKVAGCLEKEIPLENISGTTGLGLDIIPLREKSFIQPGNLPADVFPKSSLNWGTFIIVLSKPKPVACTRPADGNPDKLGYISRVEVGRMAPTTQYILPAERRTEGAARPLCIVCYKSISGPQQECGIELRSHDGRDALTFIWLVDKLVGPEPIWATYEKFARTVVQSIFADRPKDDFQ